jgi:predicted TIM-barrel fold metal-dependent hydrolase
MGFDRKRVSGESSIPSTTTGAGITEGQHRADSVRWSTRLSFILFGSDYPFIPLAETAEGIRQLGLSLSDLQRITCDNALGLMPQRRLSISASTFLR